jgi:ligand-binding sensor domain-containing protein
MQVGLDIVTSAFCKSQLRFQLMNIYQLLYLTSSTYFKWAAAMGKRNKKTEMFLIKMALNPIILFSVLTIFTSRNGQDKKTMENKSQVPVTVGDIVSKIGKNIRFIFQDNQNNFLFASDGEGLYRYDGKTTFHFTEKDGLCINFVRLIQQEKDGIITISTSIGICGFYGKQFSTLQPVDNKIEIPQTSKLTKNYSQTPYAVYCSYKDRKGNIWFGTNSGITNYYGKTFTAFGG